MSPRIRRMTAVMSAATLVGAAGIGAAQAATTTDANSTTNSAQRAGGPPGRGGPTAAQLQSIASKLGVTTAKLTAAIEANRPAPPTGDRRGDRGAGRASELATALGVEASKVQAILDANRPARPAAGSQAARPAKHDHPELIAALASGLGIEQATVRAAVDKLEASHQADHQARHDAQYAAIAKTLGLEADAVKTAFEAVRPARPAR